MPVVGDETQPLLHDPDRNGVNDTEAQQPPRPPMTPLPKVQFAVLCYLRVLDPLNFSQIFPYVNAFITTLHMTEDPSKIGIYSGIAVRADRSTSRNRLLTPCTGECICSISTFLDILVVFYIRCDLKLPKYSIV